METASLYVQKVGVVLPGTMSHVIVSDTKKLYLQRGEAKMLIKESILKQMCRVLN